MTTPKKERILRRGRAIAMERQVRAGLPAITPSEEELKESGVFREAQLSEMRVDQEALAEQRKYLQEMASEFRLMVIPFKGLRVLKRETGYEWTNGWTKHKKREKKPTTALPKPSSVIPYTTVTREQAKRKRKPKPTIPQIVEKHRKQWDKKILGLTKAKPKPIPDVLPKKYRKPSRIAEMIKMPKPIIQPTKPRKKRHVERSGKTMRALRKINGVKVFSFPDDVWKVRKTRKKRRR